MLINRLHLLILCLIPCSFTAQTFSPNREKFTKEFQKSLAEYGKGEFQEFSKKLLPAILLESKDFSEAYFTKMVETCNTMAEKKLKPYPEIFNYVFSTYSFVKAKQSSSSYTAWHSAVDKLLDSRNIKKFEDFIELSAGFFSERRIAEASNFNWYFEGGEYAFEFNDKPLIKCSNGNLVCRTINKSNQNNEGSTDSLVIYQTNGTYDPVLKKWQGEKGTVTWEKVGLSKSETFATLNIYGVSCKTATLSADSVSLKTSYFSRMIQGSLADRAFNSTRETDKVFPQFLSHEKRLEIKNITQNINYIGGFSLKGNNFLGMGTPDEPAQIVVLRDNNKFLNVQAQQIIVTQKKIQVDNAAVSIYLHSGDSISHAGLLFNYDLVKKTIEMLRLESGKGQSPFQDSYHQLDVYVPRITWNENSDELLFTFDFVTSQEQKIARFESKNYFDEQLYDKLQGLEAVHPLIGLSKYSYKYDELEFNEGKAASALGKTVDQAKPMLMELANLGFITYDMEKKMVRLNRKLDNFVQGKVGKLDYDNLLFESDLRPVKIPSYTQEEMGANPNLQVEMQGAKQEAEMRKNATFFGVLNLKTLNLSLNAVDKVNLSNYRNTTIFPRNGVLTIGKNRSFSFNGWINAGKMEINTLEASYDYAENTLQLIQTDQCLLRVNPLRKEDGNRPITMGSSIVGVKGSILVDAVTNRSGKNKKITNFPLLKVTNDTKVYYNAKAIHKGAYDSTRFYFAVRPFELDSLNDFNEKELRLEGELTSAGIFPKLQEKLKVMGDYSFGFAKQAPTEGLDFYGTGAKFNNKIVLSNNGLQGSGSIHFMQSISEAKVFTFLPDSTIGIAKFTNKPIENGVEFPDVNCSEAFVTYVPKENYLKASATPKFELEFFNSEAKLRGTAIVRKDGMRGSGTFTFKTATITSSDYSFNRWSILSDTASFNLKNTFAEPNENAIAFQVRNVKSNLNFKDRKGEFKANNLSSLVQFPVNQYYCKMGLSNWYMDRLEVFLNGLNESQVATNDRIVTPNFFSTHPKQDSLQFRANTVKYDLKNRTIFCENVPFIPVADARIYPDSNKLVIRKNAEMDTLTNATIHANHSDNAHRFNQANVVVMGRKNYVANGQYLYYDRDSSLHYVKMDKIGVNPSFTTVASGEISESNAFKLSKEFDFFGTMKVLASNPLIECEGQTRINHNCENLDKTWMRFSAQINPKNIQIPVSEQMKDRNGEAISAGILWKNLSATDSIGLYPTFLSKKYQLDDLAVISSFGLLQYSDVAHEFQIASKEKLDNRAAKGNFLSLHTESCALFGEGTIQLGMDFGEVEVDAVGTVNYDANSRKTDLNLTARFNFPMEKGLLENVASKIVDVYELKDIDLSKTNIERALLEWTDQKATDKFVADFTTKGEVRKLPKEMEKSLVFTGLKLTYFDDPAATEKGLISVSKSAVLVNCSEKVVLKYIPAKVFFQQNSSLVGGDRFGLEFNIPGLNNYYLDFSKDKKEGNLRIYTTDSELNAALNGMKEDKKKSRNFKYDSTTQQIYLSKFLRLFEY